MNLFSWIAAVVRTALQQAGVVADAAVVWPTSSQRGVSRLGKWHPVDRNGQHRNKERAARRRLVKAMGGRRQYLKQIKALRRVRPSLATA